MAGDDERPAATATGRIIDVTALSAGQRGRQRGLDLMPALDVRAAGRRNADDRTLARVPLADGGSARRRARAARRVEGARSANFARTGAIGNYYFVAQWFPKIGVFEDGRWTAHQFSRQHRVLLRLRPLRRAHDRAARLDRRRHRASNSRAPTTATARRRIATCRTTCTTSRGRRARTSSSSASGSSMPSAAAGGDAAAAAARARGPGRPPLRGDGRGACATTASGTAPIPTATSPSSIRRVRATPAAWSTRRSSRRARAGWRRAQRTRRKASPCTKPATSSGTASSATTSSSTVARRRPQHVLGRARAVDRVPAELPRRAVLRRLHPVAVPRHRRSCARPTATG